MRAGAIAPARVAHYVMSRIRAARWAWVAAQAVLWWALLCFLVLLAIPRVTHFDILIVRGGSMQPTIARGGIAIIDRGARSPSVGDITAFHDPRGMLVTHRVVALKDGGYITRGDANKHDDPLVRRTSDVVGVVQFSAPYLGYVLYILERPAVFLLLLGATGGYLVLSELRVIWRELRRMRAKGAEAPNDG
jgi:signal peptidase